jgi:hypothetical protein
VLRVPHAIELPHPVAEVLAQYVDLEHIEVVHPDSIGRYELLDVGPDRLRYAQVWPAWLGWRARSVIEQVHPAPDRMDFRFVGGFLRGVEVLTRFVPLGPDRTRVEEVYVLPWLPGWAWLARRLAPWIHRDVRRIWDEDLAVGLPRGGWPGLASIPAPPARLGPGERRCPHAGGPLRPCADGGWRCPWHGGRYGAAGRKVEGPGPEGLEPEASGPA